MSSTKSIATKNKPNASIKYIVYTVFLIFIIYLQSQETIANNDYQFYQLISKARNQLQLDQDLLCVMSQRSKVIDLYKTLLYMGRDYPKGYQYFRTKLKRAFDKNKTETDPEKIDKMIGHESHKMAACVAVIGKDNSPKFIKIYQCADETAGLQFHYKVHTSIDIIEEKLNVGNKTTVDIRDLYLGLLFATEEYKIYGYATNTKIKFVIVLQSSNVSLRDNEIKMIFKKLHAAYSNAVCNPFYIPGDEIKSKSFDSSVLEIMGVI